ncbi:hypothetical protein LPJ59_002881 [Coemansia sp. RSA 2399]|nr:hypothetical protein LPJ59_002881 [Coemansia sp. RSA 2399]KAJ1904388.1 hypothetical protein LPJ81_002522 [Coemansia sp. IMI 209127]
MLYQRLTDMPSYEDERARQMRENAEFLASLCISKIVPERPAPKKRVLKARDTDEYAPTRDFNTRKRSRSVSYREKDYYADLEYSRPKSKKRSGGPKLRRADPGRRIVGNRVYDSKLGHTCHQCRQKTVEKKIHCSGGTCNVMFDYRCLLVRYNEDADSIDHSDWLCPKCRGTCNCSFCMKKRGKRPTGQLSTFIKINGSDRAKEVIEAENINPDVLLSAQSGNGRSRSAPRRMMDEIDRPGLSDCEYESGGERHGSDGERPAYTLRTRTNNTWTTIKQEWYDSDSSANSESGDDSDMDAEPMFTDWEHCPSNIDWIVLIDD